MGNGAGRNPPRPATAGKRASRRVDRVRVAVYSSAALLIAGMLLTHWFCYRLPPGCGPAGPKVPRAAFERVWTSRPKSTVAMTMMMIGYIMAPEILRRGARASDLRSHAPSAGRH